jgi:rod shape determining protein RodA
LLVGALGLVMVYSASLGETPRPPLTTEATRQIVFAVVGVIVMLAAARADYRVLQRGGPLVYAGAVAALVGVLAVGSSEYGSQRWITFGGLSIQPSEIAKVALAIACSAYAAQRSPRLLTLVTSLAIVLPVVALVLLQPDMGTVLVLAMVWLGVVVTWGVRWRLLGGLLAAAGSIGPLAFAIAVPGYQRERLAVFFDPDRDPLGSGFNLRQAERAMASGGLTGDGLFGGAESHLSAVAARSSDFIFALVGEELGLLGGIALIALLGVIVWRGFEAARSAPDPFGRMLATGLTVMILSQAVVNISVNLRLFPVTGIPLPFVSQGGTALVTMFFAAGVLQSIAAHRPASPREQWRAERWL